MPEFVWRAAHADGQSAEGRTEAASQDEVLRQLRERGLTPIRVQEATGDEAAGGALPRRRQRVDRGPVRQADVLALTSELSIMLRAGLALDAALRVLIDMSHKPSVKVMLEKVLEDVKAGASLSRALLAWQAHFGDFYINMIRSGEISGQMPKVLERLAAHMQRMKALRDSVVSATLYPAILLLVAVLSLVGMLGFVVPQFEKLFIDLSDALPMPTRIVMLLGQGFKHYGLIVAVLVALAGGLIWRWLRTPAGRDWWQARLISLPVLGPLVHKYQISLFARSLGTLLDNGVPLLPALHISVETVTHRALRAALAKMAPLVKEGSRIVPAMRVTGIFEPLAINLVRVGEETGRVGAMMGELADIFDRDVETGIKRSLTLLEPLMILVLGMLIAAIIVSILLGIISVNDLVK